MRSECSGNNRLLAAGLAVDGFLTGLRVTGGGFWHDRHDGVRVWCCGVEEEEKERYGMLHRKIL